jgi:glycosyltransferase involved in cell wall biosynthesis
MRVLMASHGYPPTLSGVTLVVRKLARGLSARGHEVMVVTASERGDPYVDEDDGVQLVRVHARNNPFWPEGPIPYIGQNDLEELIADFNPDVLHSHDAGFLGLQCTRVGRRFGLMVLASCYYVPRFVSVYLGGGIADEMVESVGWAYSVWLLNRCDRVIFATEAHRKLYVEQGLKSPTTLISNGIDTTHYHGNGQRDTQVEARYALPQGRRLLFVSRLARDKAIDELIEAMPRVRAQYPDAHLMLVGKGPDRERLEGMVAERGLGEAVHFVGFVPEEDLPTLYRAAEVFVMASTCEVQSLPTLQALATGIPVVAADAVALPEIVHDGVNGYLVPPHNVPAFAEAVCRILSDPALARRMGLAGCDIAQQHTDARTIDLYERLLMETSHQPYRDPARP